MHILEKVMKKIRRNKNESPTLWYLSGMSIEELNIAESDHDCDRGTHGYCGTCELIFIAKMRVLNRMRQEERTKEVKT